MPAVLRNVQSEMLTEQSLLAYSRALLLSLCHTTVLSCGKMFSQLDSRTVKRHGQDGKEGFAVTAITSGS